MARHNPDKLKVGGSRPPGSIKIIFENFSNFQLEIDQIIL
jgi:hypothetical protein